jgi:hypothetical protein
MTEAVATAAGIAPPSRPACTPSTCTTTTNALDEFEKRCDSARAEPTSAAFSVDAISAARLRAAFVRSRMRVPASLAEVDATERLALCTFYELALGTPTPTTVCPDGSVVYSSRPTRTAVDTDLNVIRPLPAEKFIHPDLPEVGPCGFLSR